MLWLRFHTGTNQLLLEIQAGLKKSDWSSWTLAEAAGTWSYMDDVEGQFMNTCVALSNHMVQHFGEEIAKELIKYAGGLWRDGKAALKRAFEDSGTNFKSEDALVAHLPDMRGNVGADA